MPIIIAVDNPGKWSFEVPSVEVVAAKEFLLGGSFVSRSALSVFNLCESYGYQSLGYYVSLIAAARGYRAVPSVSSIEEMESQAVVKIFTEDIAELIAESLSRLREDEFTLSVYFGRNLDPAYDRLSMRLFNLFQAPLLRAYFFRSEGTWELRNISPIPASEVPEDHVEFVERFAARYFARKSFQPPARRLAPFDMAILVDRQERDPPSNEKALRKFEAAAEKAGFNVDFIGKDDYNKLAEYDALFIRETTQVNHHTFRFSQRAEAEGLVVIDDPLSILRCSNKVYLAERMRHNGIPIPKTVVLHPDNVDSLPEAIPFPLILKEPDSSFSHGVVKVDDADQYREAVEKFFATSDLIVAQEFTPTPFDWRVGIIDGEPLFVCKYYMARKHWQIYNWEGPDRDRAGKIETFMPELCPRKVISTALKAANLMGDGFYGVDLKEIDGRCVVVEINDNPNVDCGMEDRILKDRLYERVVDVFLERVRARKEGRGRS